MSLSQPKPKIVYQTLEELIKCSSLSKNNSSRCNPSLKKNSQRMLTQLSLNCTGKSNSKHRLDSKDKICYTETSKESCFIKSSKQFNKEDNISEKYYQQIENIYIQMEQLLCQSKKIFLRNLKRNIETGNNTKQNVKELYKISSNLRTMFSNLISTGPQNLSQNNELSIPYEKNEIKLESIDQLSKINQKKRANGRLKNIEITRTPSIYQQVLKKKI